MRVYAVHDGVFVLDTMAKLCASPIANVNMYT